MEKLILIDGNSLLNRAFYATPVFTTKNGLPTNAVFGFVKLILKIISDKKPTHFAVAFDLHAPTFRHKMYDGYKAGRKPMPQELVVQVPLIKDVLKIMGIKICEKEGFEADDVLGTLANKFDVQTFIYTGDRDAYQLVDRTTNVCFTKKGVSDLLELTAENFQDEIGLTPAQIIDLKALMGDKSDNIPGVAGIGEKTAYSLLEKYHDIDGVYAHIDEISGATQRKLIEGRENAFFSKKLATILNDAPIDVALSECVLKTPFPYALREKFAELEFKSLIAMNIFEEPSMETENADKLENKAITFGTVTEEFLSIPDALSLLDTAKETLIAVEFSDSEFRFALIADGADLSSAHKEYAFPIRMSLLDAGFFENELTELQHAIFTGKRRVIAYNVKDLMKKANRFGVAFTAEFDDVAIIKCLSDGLGNSDSLTFCLNQQGLPEKYKAFGLACLRHLYLDTLNDQERKLYYGVELPLVRVLFDMEREGITVNQDELYRFSKRYNAEIDELVEKIYELAGEKFNVNSTQQLGKILFEKLHIGDGVKKNKDSKNYKTTAEELEKYADSSEIVRLLLRYRKIQKINSTYIEGFKPLITKGKVHTTYNQYNTATGRLSSANPNLQNIPVRTDEGRELRKLFTASEGNVLIDADYSQIELRLLAHFSGCKELIQAYCEGKDIHAITASQVFNVPLSEMTPQIRREAKAVNFGIIYGISAFGLANDLNISSKRAKEYIDKYFEAYSDVKEYMNENVQKASQDGYVTTLLGRRRVINEIKSSNRTVRSFGERAAMNMPLQGSSADIIKIAMINVYNRLIKENYKAKLVLQIHDELIIDCPKNEADNVATILKEEMENAVKLSVPLTVEVAVGQNWYETK